MVAQRRARCAFGTLFIGGGRLRRCRQKPSLRPATPVKVRDVIAVLVSNGFRLDRQRGSHRHFEGVASGKRRLVTVPGKDNDEVPAGTLSSIRRQSGLRRELFR